MSFMADLKRRIFNQNQAVLEQSGISVELFRPVIYWFYLLNPFVKTGNPSFPKLKEIDPLLESLGIEVHDYLLERKKLEEFMAKNIHHYFNYFSIHGYGKAFVGKASEHFVASQLSGFSHGVFVDIAAAYSPFYQIVKDLFPGSTVFQQDLIYKKGVDGDKIGGDAANFELENGRQVDWMTLHNSIEHFEGDSDTAFIRQCSWILKRGGEVIILPVFLREKHINYVNPTVDRTGLRIDQGAEVIYVYHQPRFMRHYSPDTFKNRIIQPFRDQFKFELFRIVLSDDFDEPIELAIALRLTKT